MLDFTTHMRYSWHLLSDLNLLWHIRWVDGLGRLLRLLWLLTPKRLVLISFIGLECRLVVVVFFKGLVILFLLDFVLLLLCLVFSFPLGYLFISAFGLLVVLLVGDLLFNIVKNHFVLLTRKPAELEVAVNVDHCFDKYLNGWVIKVNTGGFGCLFVGKLRKVFGHYFKRLFLVHKIAFLQPNNVLAGLEAQRYLFRFRTLLAVLEQLHWLLKHQSVILPAVTVQCNRRIEVLHYILDLNGIWNLVLVATHGANPPKPETNRFVRIHAARNSRLPKGTLHETLDAPNPRSTTYDFD